MGNIPEIRCPLSTFQAHFLTPSCSKSPENPTNNNAALYLYVYVYEILPK